MKLALIQPDVIFGSIRDNARQLAACIHNCPQAELYILPSQAIEGPQAAPGSYNPSLDILAWLSRQLPPDRSLFCGLTQGCFLLENGNFTEIGQYFRHNDQVLAIYTPEKGDAPNLDMLILPAAEPFFMEDWGTRQEKLCQLAASQNVWVLAPNLAGGYGQYIYPGQSLVISPAGEICGQGKAFAPDMVFVDTDAPTPVHTDILAPYEALWLALVTGLHDFCHKAGCNNALLGLSGGMDSALVACLASEALGPDHVTGVLMPSPWTSDASITDAEELAHNLGIKTITVPITPMLQSFSSSLEPAFADMKPHPGDLTYENLQARIRGVILMALSNRGAGLVLNTGNRSEAAMGYCTLYGDTAGALAVIGDIFKTQVYKLAAWFNRFSGSEIIPRNIFDKPPSAELRPDQKDTDSLPPYEELDPMLAKIFSGQKSKDLATLAARVLANEFKRRQSPPPLLVSKYHLLPRFTGGIKDETKPLELKSGKNSAKHLK